MTIDAKPSYEQYCLDLRHEVLYRAELAALYHRKRERFLALSDRVGKALSLIAGTAAFSSLLPDAAQKAYAGLVVAVMTLPGLIFAWADKARLHSELAQKYIAIISEIEAKGLSSFDETDCATWLSKVRALEANEPPSLSILVSICQNQIALAAGQPEKYCHVGFIRSLFAHFVDIAPHSKPQKPKKEKTA
jgi:hypothetical protein